MQRARYLLGWITVWMTAWTRWDAVQGAAAGTGPAPQEFVQEVARHLDSRLNLPSGTAQLIDVSGIGAMRGFGGGEWFEWRENAWQALSAWKPASDPEFVLAGVDDQPVRVRVPWASVRQVLRQGARVWLSTVEDPYTIEGGEVRTMGWPSRHRVHQIAAAPDGPLYVASSGGLFSQVERGWAPVGISDPGGRIWGVGDVLGVVFDAQGRLWFATRAGVGCRSAEGWRFFEGKDGLPWNDFTGMAAGPGGEVWFGTRLGAIRFEAEQWHYRQGARWLPGDEVRQVAVDAAGGAWFITDGGIGRIDGRRMTLAAKADHYEEEIERYVKRTPLGYVSEAALRQPGDRTSANPQDSDNDGLWTAMYGAGECFAYAVTKDPKAKERARKAFEALRFLQKVTQGGDPAPPKGYVARTIRPIDWPDPNVGRLDRDRAEQQEDRLWKVIDPRWPKSADGKWYWKCDTSSDELDGHFFFYPLYHDLCADTDAERERVREVVRGLTDHLIAHDFNLVDHDGRPTRWGVFGPADLNRNPDWWPERGLNSLSILSYLAVAGHVTGDPKYATASRQLIETHGYAQNLMYPKVQQGPGSGNQSDDEMAFMCFYSLLRHSTDEALKVQVRWSFLRYWANEAPELNPFFNFAYAGHNATAEAANPWGRFSLRPWGDWLEDSLAALRGFSLDRLNWPHRNSHRLDIEALRPPAVRDIYEAGNRSRGHRWSGKVLPVENRHFNHWNTDPWRLDYDGIGNDLAAGTVFLLPYYMGMYHGYIARP